MQTAADTTIGTNSDAALTPPPLSIVLGDARLDGPDNFQLPWFAANSAWLGHLLFARWLVRALRPACLVELGVFNGASFLTLCHSAEGLGIGARCIGIDTWMGDVHAGFYTEAVYRRLSGYVRRHHRANARLLRMTFDRATARIADESIDLLHIDGLHFYEAVKHDFETWLPKMSKRGVILFHDICETENGFGVHRLWAEISAAYPHFAFEHAHGLGVLGVGPDIPAPLMQLFEAAGDREQTDRVRTLFEEAGDPKFLRLQVEPVSGMSRIMRWFRRK